MNDLFEATSGARPFTPRQAALCELLALPDPPDIRRGHEPKCEGDPRRYELIPEITAAFVQQHLLDLGKDGR